MDPALYTTSSPEPDAASQPSPRGAVGSGPRRPRTRRLRRDEVYADLKRRLMTGEFGVQTRLVEERLAELLGVSRTPVREALVRLHADGTVTRRDGGYYVALPDLDQLRDLYELRITLEVRGLTRALGGSAPGGPAPVHDAALLEPLRDSWRVLRAGPPRPTPEFVLVDEDFHVTLLRAAGNAVLTETLASVNARIRSVRMYDFLTEDRIDRTIAEHLEVVELVLARDIEGALNALRRHVGVSMEVVERRAAAAITQMLLMRGGSP